MKTGAPSSWAAAVGALTGLLLVQCAHAAVMRVNTGTAKPSDYHTVQAALNAARPGDRIVVAAGIYRERVHFVSGGREQEPVILEGEPGAVIDGSTPADLAWAPAPDIGPDVYRAPLAKRLRKAYVRCSKTAKISMSHSSSPSAMASTKSWIPC